jgi:outer membrane receptor protein involved in Fe transport
MTCPLFRVTSALALALAAAPPLRAMQQDSSTARVVITIDSLDRAAFANIAELLQARVPGLHISRTGDGGMRWFMRGPSSASESTPLVLIDDVRFNVAGSAIREFGTRPPLLDEIDVEDVERIEVWSGPATAARYGTGAGNGVIRIVTFAPRAQSTSFRISTAAGTVDKEMSYPANYNRAGVDSAGAPVRWCTLRLEASGGCTPGALTSINVLESDSPFETAVAARIAATVASGNEWVAWRGGTTFDRQGSTTGALANQRLSLRGAAALGATQDAKLTVRAHWMRGNADLPSLNEQSVLRQALFARADRAWPGFAEPHSSRYASMRYGAAVTGLWRPRDSFDARLISGVERMLDEDDLEYVVPGGMGFGPLYVDMRGERRRRDVTVRLETEARYGAGAWGHATAMTLERAASRQEEEFRGFQGQDGASLERAFWINRPTDISGVGLTQRLQLGHRAAFAGGVRLDWVELNDVRWDVPLSPHLSLSWDARPFTPAPFGGVRLRAALGDVANVPQTMGLFFLTGSSGSERPKAEVTRERELGADVLAAKDRVGLSVTWYTKRTSNIPQFSEDPFFVTSGRLEVLNRGIEASLRARILRTARVTWDTRAWYTHNHNEVRRNELGLHRIDLAELGVFQHQFVAVRQPLAAIRAIPVISIRDLDNDGLLDNACFEGSGDCEVTISRAVEFRPPFPPRSASLATSVGIGAVTFSVLLDHRSGHSLYNQTLAARCLYIDVGCQAVYDPTTPLRDQAEAILAGEPAAFVEDASYTKLREISLRFASPAPWARALGASRLDVSLAARNLATWTDYRGLDPESTSGPWIPLAYVDDAAMPLPRRFLIRVDLHDR